MKRLLSIILSLSAVISCSDLTFGSRFLEKAPGADVTADTIFSSKLYAERALNSAYATLRSAIVIKSNGEPQYDYQQTGNRLGWDNLDALTDVMSSHNTWGGVQQLYYSGVYNAEQENSDATHASSSKLGFNPGQDATWSGIRKAFLFMENVDRVPDMTDAEKVVRKGEARMIIACHYHELLRHFGGVPILTGAVDASNSLNVDFTRQTFDATVEYILDLCDQAATELPWRVERADDGRFSAASALALKIRVLLYAASPLFNANEPYLPACQPTTANAMLIPAERINYMAWYGNYDQDRWQRVIGACEDFFEQNRLNGNQYHLVEPLTRDTQGYREAFAGCYADRYNSEILIETFRNVSTFGESYHRMLYGPSADIDGNQGRGFGNGCITLNYTDMFPYADGEPASYSAWLEKNGHEGTLSDNPFTDRDPRLYESVMIVGDTFQSRPAEMWIGGYERKQYNDGRAKTGFCVRKFLWDYNNATFHTRPANYAYLRMAEIHLAYAEALNETGQKELAYQELNKVRNRVGLPDMTDDLLARLQAGKTLPSYSECSLVGDPALREEILDERAREFCFEEVRWFDIVRWKRADIFQKTLYAIDIYLLKGQYQNPDGSTYINPDEVVLQFSDPKNEFDEVPRYWTKNFSPKWYLSAFPTDEINKGYGLLQNPGW